MLNHGALRGKNMFAVMNTAITGVIVLHNIQNIDTVTYCTMLSAEVYWNETKNRIRLVVCSLFITRKNRELPIRKNCISINCQKSL